jgi:hypothetical protein
MGRLAGPVCRETQLKNERFFKEIEQRHQEFQAMTPLVHPPSLRRQMALLWLISSYWMEFHVGVEGCPPLTADMRLLLARGYLRMDRNRPAGFLARTAIRGNRYNRLSLTTEGQRVLAQSKISQSDRDYIQRALQTGVVR